MHDIIIVHPCRYLCVMSYFWPRRVYPCSSCSSVAKQFLLDRKILSSNSSDTLGGPWGVLAASWGDLAACWGLPEGAERLPDELKAGKPPPNLAEPPLKVAETALNLAQISGLLSALNNLYWRANGVLSIKLSHMARTEKFTRKGIFVRKSA